MPRNSTTGVFVRVNNTFSHPVFGTLLDPTDASSYFDDLDVGLNPPELDGPVRFINSLQVGTAGSADGTIDFLNATSGQITLTPPAGALGTRTLTLPAATDTIVGRATTDTLSNKTLVAPALGTPVSGILANTTGFPLANLSGAGTGVLTFLATPSSANLLSALTTKTGTGNAVFSTSPNISTPTGIVKSDVGLGNVANVDTTNASNISSGTLPAGRTNGHMNGEPGTGSAAAGEVGEYNEGILTSGSATALTTGTAKTVTSITLSAGDWDVSGIVYFSTAASTSVTSTIAGFSTTTNTLDTTAGRWAIHTYPAVVPGNLTGLSETLPRYRFSLSGSTTIFLIAQSGFTVSTNSAWGIINYRRAR